MKPLYLAILIIAITNLPGLKVLSQEYHDDHGHHITEHINHQNEIGGSLGPVFDISEEKFGLGLHLHYTRMFGNKCEKFGFGGSLEAVFAEEIHNNITAVVVYRPVHSLWISAGPGITYFHETNRAEFSVHLETGYEFETKIVHLGPMIEYSFAGDDHHIMLGFHVGYPF